MLAWPQQGLAQLAWARGETQRALAQLPLSRDRLTPREQQVTALIARGYSSQQIADTLAIGRRTAEMHVGRLPCPRA